MTTAEREQFEEWWYARESKRQPTDSENSAWAGWQARAATVARPPREPTAQMIEAGYHEVGKTHYSPHHQKGWGEDATAIYQAMWDAAPVDVALSERDHLQRECVDFRDRIEQVEQWHRELIAAAHRTADRLERITQAADAMRAQCLAIRLHAGYENAPLPEVIAAYDAIRHTTAITEAPVQDRTK